MKLDTELETFDDLEISEDFDDELVGDFIEEEAAEAADTLDEDLTDEELDEIEEGELTEV